MKAAFYFTLKAFSVIKIFMLFSNFFGHVRKQLDIAKVSIYFGSPRPGHTIKQTMYRETN